MSALATALDELTRRGPPHPAAARAARDRWDRLAKPPGSLGTLEDLGARLAAITGSCPPPEVDPAVVVVFAGDHGVTASGVTPWPSSVTAAVVGAMVAGRAGISALSRSVGARLRVVDVGLATPVRGAEDRAVVRGTADLATGPAMTRVEVAAALDVGAEVAAAEVADGARCLLVGEVGIGNTTAAAALVAAATGADPGAVTGPGAGSTGRHLERKREVVAAAASRARDLDPVGMLAEVGGAEIAAVCGAIVAGVAAGVPVILDGVVTLAAAVVATDMHPAVAGRLVASHRSPEPATGAACSRLGLTPLLDLGMRLGEGTGACLALPLLRAARAALADMATLDDLAGPS